MNGLNKGFLRKVIKMMCQTPVKNLPSHITKGSEVKIQGEIEKKQKNCYTTIQD